MKLAFIILIIFVIASLFGLVNFNIFSTWLSNFIEIISTPLIFIIKVLTSLVEVFSTNFYFTLTLSVLLISVLFRFLLDKFTNRGE